MGLAPGQWHPTRLSLGVPEAGCDRRRGGVWCPAPGGGDSRAGGRGAGGGVSGTILAGLVDLAGVKAVQSVAR